MRFSTWVVLAVLGLAVAAPSCGVKCPPGMEGTPGSCSCLEGYVPVNPNDPTNLGGCVPASPGPSATPSTSPAPTPTPASSGPPIPLPTPTPTAQPTATPTPAPSTTPSVPITFCGSQPECAGPQSAPGVYGCCTTNGLGGWGEYQAFVDAAVNEWMVENGRDWVYRSEWPPNQQEIAENAFVKDIAARIRLKGACVTTKLETPGGGTPDEVGVRIGPAFSEQYDIVLSNGHVRSQSNYVARCKPARF